MSSCCNVNGNVILKSGTNREDFKKKFEKLLHENCPNFDYESTGDVVSISANGDYTKSEHAALLDFLESHIKNGCIVCNGEYNVWRYLFRDGKWEIHLLV